MNKFLKDLETELNKMKISKEEIKEILADHQEMIKEAINEGLTDDEIYSKFGNPLQLAKDLCEDSGEHKVDLNEYVNKAEFESIAGYELFKAFTVDELKEINIKLISENIEVYPYSGENIEVHIKMVKNKEDYEMELVNGVFTLFRKRKKILFSLSNNTGSFVVRYPSNTKLEQCKVELVSGDTELQGINTKLLKLKSTSGDYDVKGIVAGETELTTVSGDFEMFDINLENVRISTVSGDFEGKDIDVTKAINNNISNGETATFRTVSGDREAVDFYVETIDLRSVSGDIVITNHDSSKQIQIGRKRTVSGDITITQ